MADIKPFWWFVGGLCLLYIFALIVKPTGYRPYPGPAPYAPFGPGGTRHLLGPGGVRRLYEGFESTPVFKMFGVKWCPHCQTAKPEFLKLGSTVTIGGQSVSVQYIDPEEDRAAVTGYEVDGYPTFYLDTGSQKMKYSGPRNEAGFRQFLQETIGGA
jgi:thiol-disulfide isomerase/thioredoxin